MTSAKEPPTRPRPTSFLKSVISQLKPQRHPEASANEPSDKLKSNNRCQFTFDDGRRCKLPPAQLCAHHSPKQNRGAKRVSDASSLEALCADLTTTTSINRALAQTFLLMTQGRISPQGRRCLRLSLPAPAAIRLRSPRRIRRRQRLPPVGKQIENFSYAGCRRRS
jgi:hypothetical protein